MTRTFSDGNDQITPDAEYTATAGAYVVASRDESGAFVYVCNVCNGENTDGTICRLCAAEINRR